MYEHIFTYVYIFIYMYITIIPLVAEAFRVGKAVQDVQKRTRGEREGRVENKNTHNKQINLNKQKLGEP